MIRLLCIITLIFTVLFSCHAVFAVEDGGIPGLIVAARAGTTVSLPAGTFTVSGVDVPAGVSLKGAGYNKTILIVNGDNGLHFQGGARLTISDLTIRNANNTGLYLEHVDSVTLSRVRVLGCLSGIIATGGRNIRLENCVSADNRTGLALNGVGHAQVVNCTIARNTALGASLSATTDSIFYNNVLTTNAIGIMLAQTNAKLVVDHNVYWGALIGRGKDEGMPTIYAWRDMERQDHHSITLPVDYTDPNAGIFKPSTTLPWAFDRAMTAGWGVPKLADCAAPAEDIDRQPRQTGAWGVGAWEAKFTPERPADGKFTIENADGYASAGLYDKDNRAVAWLFKMLPLAKGTFRYWLPTRDWQGRSISAGQYLLRISEADLSLKFISMIGNTGVEPTPEACATTGIAHAIFDSKDRPIVCLGWTECYQQFRGMDPGLTKERWRVPGSSPTYGTASDGKGHFYSLRDGDAKTYILSRLDEETGAFDEVEPGAYGWYFPKKDLGAVNGVAVLNDCVYLLATERGKVLVGPKFETGYDVSSPLGICADRKRQLLWLLSTGSKVQALTPDGAIRYQWTPDIPGICSMAVNGDRLVLLSSVTGKAYLYSLTDPVKPALERAIGTGDNACGPIQPDRFQFMTGEPTTEPNQRVALDSKGTIAITDIIGGGVKLFTWRGVSMRVFTGIWGQFLQTGLQEPGKPLEVFDQASRRAMLLDEKTGTWKWGVRYGVPPPLNNYQPKYSEGFYFRRDGKLFGLFYGMVNIAGRGSYPLVIMRYDTPAGTPVVAFGDVPNDDPKMQFRLGRFDDFSKDFTDYANWKPVLDEQGKSISNYLFLPSPMMKTMNGDIVLGGTWGMVTRIPLKGLDARGVPEYDFSHVEKLPLRSGPQDAYDSIVSPYDYKTRENFPGGVHHAESFSDGTIATTVYLTKTGHSEGLSGWSGTEVAGFDAKGFLRWLQPMADCKDAEGTRIVDDLCYTISLQHSELQVLDKDGMYLGITGVPRELYWHNMCLDNTSQYAVLKGSIGQHYVIFGNFNDSCAWWMQVQGRDTIKRYEQAVMITDAVAATLAQQPAPPVWRKPENTATQVNIRKLEAPLPIDGELSKWRKVVPTPQIIITPETSFGGTQGPADSSALIRLAHEGGNLYVQMLRFDNLVTMHQMAEKFYQQDALEMAINTFYRGIKLNVTHTRDQGDAVIRDSWSLPKMALDPAKAPRVIKVLDNAQAIEERKLIEQIYGTDLSHCKVIVTEFKVPLTDDSLYVAGDMKGERNHLDQKPAATSGSTMYLGIMIDDNDFPGADLQKLMFWPATYNTFGDKSINALVLFE